MLLGLMVIAATVAGQDATIVRGDVRRDDGAPVAGAPVTVTCGAWQRTVPADASGLFRVEDVPTNVACRVRADWPGRPGHGLAVDRTFRGDTFVRIALPAALTLPPTPSPASGGLQLSFSGSPLDETTRLPGGWSLSGTATASAGATSPGATSSDTPLAIPLVAPPALASPSAALVLPWSPASAHGAVPSHVFTPDAAQGWSVGVTASRRGPWGTLFTGTARARREGVATTLLNDVTDTAMAGTGAYSMLTDPRTPLLWDVRLRLERRFDLGSSDLTVFGEAYRTWLGASRGGLLLPLGNQRSSSRSGAAARAGIKLGF